MLESKCLRRNLCIQLSILYFRQFYFFNVWMDSYFLPSHQVNLTKDALELLIMGEHWDKARQIVTDRAPHFKEYVDSAFKQKLKDRQQPDEIVSVDVAAALEMYANNKNWEKCLQVIILMNPSTVLLYFYFIKYR